MRQLVKIYKTRNFLDWYSVDRLLTKLQDLWTGILAGDGEISYMYNKKSRRTSSSLEIFWRSWQYQRKVNMKLSLNYCILLVYWHHIKFFLFFANFSLILSGDCVLDGYILKIYRISTVPLFEKRYVISKIEQDGEILRSCY